jgi:hypothetical protein
MLLRFIFVLPVLAFFVGVGVVGLSKPESVLAYFGTTSLTRDGRNEVRGMYGGLSLASAVALGVALVNPVLGPGILVSVTLVVAGIASGRLLSVLIDGRPGFYPWLFLGVELVLVGLLLLAYWLGYSEAG